MSNASQESVFLTSTIDSADINDVILCDILNELVRTKIIYETGEEILIMKITEILVDMLVNLDLKGYALYLLC